MARRKRRIATILGCECHRYNSQDEIRSIRGIPSLKGIGTKIGLPDGGYEVRIPIIACYRAWYLTQVTFICPWCGRQHFHGSPQHQEFASGDGHRGPHCPPEIAFDTAELKYGYILKEVIDPELAGDIPKKYLRKERMYWSKISSRYVFIEGYVEEELDPLQLEHVKQQLKLQYARQ